MGREGFLSNGYNWFARFANIFQEISTTSTQHVRRKLLRHYVQVVFD